MPGITLPGLITGCCLAVAGLLVLGMLMVYSTTFDYGMRFKDEATYYFKRQFMALLLGVGWRS